MARFEESAKQGYVIGIDTGGTYTDGVVLDRTNKKVLSKFKALTTKGDLSEGIIACLAGLEKAYFPEVEMVALSTTLATNAIVEGHGGQVGLISIGQEIDFPLPTNHYRSVAGEVDIHGNEVEPLNLLEVDRAIDELKEKVKVFAVSGFLSVRNPDLENKVKSRIIDKTSLPVVCAHELTTELGYKERTVTVVLNGKLIPIIDMLIHSVQKALKTIGIKVPLVMVKGDGALMSLEMCRHKPIETILSGPAASVVGGQFLSKSQDGIVVDIGGTTTDIAVLRDGKPSLNKEGARVGGWLTRVKSADINTYGLGGDSWIKLDEEKQIEVGPQRVLPICRGVSQYPHLLQELNMITDVHQFLRYHQIIDAFMYVSNGNEDDLQPLAESVLAFFKDKPHTLSYLMKKFSQIGYGIFQELKDLLKRGCLLRISLTPTDILHIQDEIKIWNSESSQKAAEILAKRNHLKIEDLVKKTYQKILDRYAYTIFQSALWEKGVDVDLEKDPTAAYFLEEFLNGDQEMVSFKMALSTKVIGIGAPAEIWLKKLGNKIKTEIFSPPNCEVANAIGAAVGEISETFRVKIIPDGFKYKVHSPWECKSFEELEIAKNYVKDGFIQFLKKEAFQDEDLIFDELMYNEKDIYFEDRFSEEKIFMETIFLFTFLGKARWGQNVEN